MIEILLRILLKHCGTRTTLEYSKDVTVTRYDLGHIALIEKCETLALYGIQKRESIVFHKTKQPVTNFEVFDIFGINK